MGEIRVRRNDKANIDWKITNYVPKTVVGLEVDQDPGAGFGTVAVAPAPDANTKTSGVGHFDTEMPKLGDFVFTLTVKKPKGDEKSTNTVHVEEVKYKSFTGSAPKIELGKQVTLSWEVELAKGCTFKLVVTDPSGTETQTDVAVDAKGKGSFKTTPTVLGVHKFRLLCTDPLLKSGQKSPDSPIVQVDVKDHPTLKVVYDDFKKLKLQIQFNGTAVTVAPGFKIQAGNVFSASGEMKVTPDFANTGNFEAVQEVPATAKEIHVEIFPTKQVAGAKPIAQDTFFFAAPATSGGDPVVTKGKLPDVTGKVGTPFLDDPRIAALKLSAKRIKVIKDFVPLVMPSEVGSKAFDNLATKAVVDKTVEDNPGYTTCVEVPPFLSRKFGEALKPHPFMMGGIIGCYWAGTEAANVVPGQTTAFVVAEAGLAVLPTPGDLFIIAGKTTTVEFIKGLKPTKKGTKRTDAFEMLHVGVIVDVAPGQVTAGGLPLWIVCQAGAGPVGQSATYSREVIEPDAKIGPLLSGRRLGGWINIDNYLHWT